MQRPMTRAATAAAIVALGLLPMLGSAQDFERSRFIATSDVLSSISMFTFQERRKSDLILRATPVISRGEGKAEVEYENGNASISAEVRWMPPPATLGPFTTYVLWTLTPDGRATNEGVLAGHEGGSGEIDTQHPASQFALIVTAEPHFAVSVPSNMVVMYNVADRIRGVETKIASLFERADYAFLTPIELDDRPMELIQAEYSITIADAAGAEEFVPNSLYAAQAKLDAARVAWGSTRRDRRLTPGLAREAVIAGEDARRAALVARVEADAQAEREAAAEAAAAAERERAAAAAAAERERAEALLVAERERAALERELAATAAAEEADARARARARAELLNRLSSVLPTRETDRGLVSEIGGVQFATGTANLNGQAQVTLARFSGIVASYPELRFTIEGHTDNVGSVENNRELSLRRAISVRDYLIGLGVPASSINVDGFGLSRPVADNSTAEGRARNRRVEIVISGGMLTVGNR